MPDITMCHDTACPKRHLCYRSESSGTRPDPRYQSWFVESPRTTKGCEMYEPAPNSHDHNVPWLVVRGGL